MLLTSRQITSGLSWIVKHQVSAENWRIASSGKTHTHWSTEVFNVWWSGWKQGAFHNTYQFSSVSQSCLTLCDLMDCSMPGFPVHHQLLELTWTHVHWVGDAIQQSHPLSSPSPVFILSQHQGLFSNESVLRIRRSKYWSFSFSISPSNEHPGLISFRMDWLDLLAVQGTLKSLLQHLYPNTK